MFYEQLYAELGKLFYNIAAADGKINSAEKEALQKAIRLTWEPLETSSDRYGTDRANIITFSFDFEEAEDNDGDGFASFSNFYERNRENFTSEIKRNILKTCVKISSAFRGTNKSEMAVLQKLEALFSRKSD